MKTLTSLTILFSILTIIGIGSLIWNNIPNVPDVPGVPSKIINTHTWKQGFQVRGDTAPVVVQTENPTETNTEFKFENNDNKLNSLMSSWQDDITQATSAEIAIIATTSTPSKSTTTLGNPGDILKRMNQQFTQSQKSASVSDDDVNSLVYYTSSVDLRANKQNTSASNKKLREYGNSLAKLLTTFRLAQGDQLAVLDKFIKNSTDQGAQSKVNKLARAYSTLAKDIIKLKVPKDIKNINTAIATSLSEMSEQLRILSTMREDSALYNQALIYNESSASLAKNVLRLIDTFMFAGIKFKSYEPGSIFMFK